MLSSTTRDLLQDRRAIADALTSTGIVQLLGVSPATGPSHSSSSYAATTTMATQCHLLMLILGRRYGYVTHSGRSATELEFEAARAADPTKILVFHKTNLRVEALQKQFIDRVTDYHKGYFIRSYASVADLSDLALTSFETWLSERVSPARPLHYFNSFIRLALQRPPFPDVYPLYTVADNYLEISYRVHGKMYVIHYDKASIYNDFWGSVLDLGTTFEEWKLDYRG